MKKPEEKKAPLERIEILSQDGTELRQGHTIGQAIGAGQTFARSIQVLPGNLCTPTFVAERAQELAQRHGFEITVLDKAAIIKEKMGALMSVAQGSAEEPRFIAIEYKGSAAAPVVLVGKGVTFDTGGISIKPAQNMEDMKYDMSGAAAVLGTFEMLGRLKPNVHVVGLIPSTENMPSGTAVKPGDVVTSHFGKTIEIKNSGGRPAGSISAGWFLREFVDGFPWAHLDIAGTAYSDRDDATRVKGPTGMGVRLFTEFVLARS